MLSPNVKYGEALHRFINDLLRKSDGLKKGKIKSKLPLLERWKGDAIIMFVAHVKAVRDLRNNYSEISRIVKNHDHVIITNNGKSEAAKTPHDEFKNYDEFMHIRYVKKKLSEAEAVVGDPNEWITVGELLKERCSWDALKI